MPSREAQRDLTIAEAGSEDAPPIRIPYNAVRHAIGRSGRVKVSALEIKQEADTVVVTPVNSRNALLQSCIELPFRPEVLRKLATVLEQLATKAEGEIAAIRETMREIKE